MRSPVPLLALLSACNTIFGFEAPMHPEKRIAGASCTAGADGECASGHCITEGPSSICCNESCTEGCRSCFAASTSKPDGQCDDVELGLDPKSTCAEGECTTGACDGSGSCGNVEDRMACSDGGSCCGGACVSERTDSANCGMCAQSCSTDGGEICAAGSCGVVDWALWPMPNGPGEPNPSSYTDPADGTVTDNVTHLMWQKAVNANTYSFESAKQYCATTLSGLGLGGHHDWRLPSRIELVSLVNLAIASPGPTIDATFSGTPAELFWTATPFTGTASSAWFVSFASGGSGYRVMTDSYRVRCVR
jgi:hypothetical protein